jgi:hypothetical protein
MLAIRMRKAMRQHRWLDYGLSLIVSAFALLAVTGQLVIAAPAEPWKLKDTFDAMTAVGTVGAVIVALGIAIFDSRARSREESARAKLAAAAALIPLKTMVECLHNATAELESDAAIGPTQFQVIQKARNQLAKGITALDEIDLVALIPLRTGEASAGIARALSLARAVEHDLSSHVGWIGDVMPMPAGKEPMTEATRQLALMQLRSASQFIGPAMHAAGGV